MRTGGRVGRGGFTLVEVLVTVSIIVVLVALFGGAISAGRSGSQVNATQGTVARLDQIISTQYRRYEARRVSREVLRDLQQPMNLGTSGSNAAAARSWHIRRSMITGDMPDRWSDVASMASGTSVAYLRYDYSGASPVVSGTVFFPQSVAQASYIATYNAAVNAGKTPTDQYGGAECLFMIVMQGGFADCLDCNGAANVKKGDKDGDGAVEFWDDWNNPIDYILWAPAYQQRGGTTKLFGALDAAFPATGSVRPGLGMRPIVYSAGPDGKYGLNRNPTSPAVTAADTGANTAMLTSGASPTGRDCGNPVPAAGASVMGGPGTVDGERADNIVNVELKAES